MIVLHSSVSATVPVSSSFRLFDRISFKNLAYEGILSYSLIEGYLDIELFEQLNKLPKLFLNLGFR